MQRVGSSTITPGSYPACDLAIIVAEDHSSNRIYAVSLLNKLGYHPRVASNGLEVLELVRQAPCDVILMDCHMPEIDGLEATKTIRFWESKGILPNTKPIHIMAVTANSSELDKEACMQSGMDSFVGKPLLRQSLRDALMEIWMHGNLKSFDNDMAEDLRQEFDAISKTLAQLSKDIGDDATHELVYDFLESTPGRLVEMKGCIESDSMEDLRRLAHSYKSVCKIYGLDLMSHLCAELELKAQAKEIDQAVTLITQIQELFDTTKSILERSLTPQD